MKPDPQYVTINQLSEEFGSDRRTIKKWLAQEGLSAGDNGNSAEEVRAAIKKRKSLLESGGEGNEGSGDAAEKIRQEVIKLKRENRIQERLEAETYMETDTVERMILMGISKIENIPSKMESEFGLPLNQVKRLTQLLDEARVEWAKGLKGMGK